MPALSHEYELSVMKVSPNGQDPINYNECLQSVCTISSPAELSYLLRRIKQLNLIDPCNVNIFKKGIAPAWEHPENANGCSWTVQLRPTHARTILEHLSLFLCIVQFKHIKCNGIKINIREKYVRFEIWSGSVPLVTDGHEVVSELRQSLGISFPVDFIFKSHKELITRVVKQQ